MEQEAAPFAGSAAFEALRAETYFWLGAPYDERTALGRRDEQGRRQLPGLRRDHSRSGSALARSHQGGGRAHNAQLGLLDQGLADRIAAAGDSIANGEHDDQFPIDVFQTGSGTSSNMNANEVIANIAGEGPPERSREHGAVVQRCVPVGGAPGGGRRG